jgi:hypothetical protein
MARFGEIATLAARTSRRGVNPVQAWNTAAARMYRDQPGSRDKSYPKSAFLGSERRNRVTTTTDAPKSYE